MSPLHLHYSHSSGAGKDINIFILSELFAVDCLGNDYVALPCGVYIYLKQCQLYCFLFMFLEYNFQRFMNKDLGQRMQSGSVTMYMV